MKFTMRDSDIEVGYSLLRVKAPWAWVEQEHEGDRRNSTIARSPGHFGQVTLLLRPSQAA